MELTIVQVAVTALILFWNIIRPGLIPALAMIAVGFSIFEVVGIDEWTFYVYVLMMIWVIVRLLYRPRVV